MLAFGVKILDCRPVIRFALNYWKFRIVVFVLPLLFIILEFEPDTESNPGLILGADFCPVIGFV